MLIPPCSLRPARCTARAVGAGAGSSATPRWPITGRARRRGAEGRR